MSGKKALGVIVGATLVGGIIAYQKNKELEKQKENTVKYLTLFREMNQYLVTKQMGKEIKDYFEQNGYKKIAIYGMSHIGQRIIDDLKNTGIQVEYGIDKRADRLSYEMKIYCPDDELPEVDVIVVTAYDFDEIAEKLSDKINCDIVAFEDIIFSL